MHKSKFSAEMARLTKELEEAKNAMGADMARMSLRHAHEIDAVSSELAAFKKENADYQKFLDDLNAKYCTPSDDHGKSIMAAIEQAFERLKKENAELRSYGNDMEKRWEESEKLSTRMKSLAYALDRWRRGWRMKAHGLRRENAELRADKERLITMQNLIEEATGNEITIARRCDGHIWITDGENTLSGPELPAAIDAARGTR